MKKITYIILLLSIFVTTEVSSQCVDNGNQWAKSWVSCQTSINPNPLRGNTHWILYEFIENHYIDTCHIWNANRIGESNTGLKDVIIDYSLDGSTWTELGSFVFDKAPETDDYQGIKGPDFESAYIKKILITVQSTHGDGSCASLGEIQFNVNDGQCHGVIDDCNICDGPGKATWYIDADGDGKGSSSSIVLACEQPQGYVDNTDDDCDSGELGWDDIFPIFNSSCKGCHIDASTSGLNLGTYESFKMGGDKFGTCITEGENLVGVITIAGYDNCGAPTIAPMNTFAGGNPITLENLQKIQRWIDGNSPELCSDFCLTDEMITSDFTEGMVGYFQTSNQIVSDSELDSATIITYDAGQEILLNNGFSVKFGGQFIAQIGGCEE